ncbi:MAG: hypothetical protein K6A44_06820 [bacterium]|nr:hypothetical protein [bacterium]
MKIGINNIAYTGLKFSGKETDDRKPIKSAHIRVPAMLTSALLMLAAYAKADVNTPVQNPTNDTAALVAYSKSALLKEREKDYKGAIEFYDKMIKLRPQNEIFYQFRGELQEKNGNYEEAISDYAIATSKYMHKKDELEAKLQTAHEQEKADALNDEIEAYENAIKANMERIRTFRKIRKNKFDYTRARDFGIEEVHQGQIMNCYFLSLLCKYPDLIHKSQCLKWNKDGTAEVSLYPVKLDNAKINFDVVGKRKTYHISNEELNATMFKFIKEDGKTIPFRLNPAQDMTLKALEIGFLKNLNADFISCNKGGSAADALKMLFGDYIIPKVGRIVTGQTDFSREDVKNGIFVYVTAQNGRYKSGSWKPVEVCGRKLVPYHTYIINGFDETKDMVSLSDPNFDDRTSTKDDIVIPFKELAKNHFKLDFVIPFK